MEQSYAVLGQMGAPSSKWTSLELMRWCPQESTFISSHLVWNIIYMDRVGLQNDETPQVLRVQ
jgi:hypothetical protein